MDNRDEVEVLKNVLLRSSCWEIFKESNRLTSEELGGTAQRYYEAMLRLEDDLRKHQDGGLPQWN